MVAIAYFLLRLKLTQTVQIVKQHYFVRLVAPSPIALLEGIYSPNALPRSVFSQPLSQDSYTVSPMRNLVRLGGSQRFTKVQRERFGMEMFGIQFSDLMESCGSIVMVSLVS
jgi:hypothetical protein